jgi:hypothetical protein
MASHGAEYCTPDDRIKIKLSMAGFVDNTKGEVNDMRMDKPLLLTTLMAQMQDAQLWGDLLPVSEGAIEIPKCNYYIMQWLFKANSWAPNSTTTSIRSCIWHRVTEVPKSCYQTTL